MSSVLDVSTHMPILLHALSKVLSISSSSDLSRLMRTRSDLYVESAYIKVGRLWSLRNLGVTLEAWQHLTLSV
jgi:hypothetical protein